jgi:hypothetical protein
VIGDHRVGRRQIRRRIGQRRERECTGRRETRQPLPPIDAVREAIGRLQGSIMQLRDDIEAGRNKLLDDRLPRQVKR